MLYASSKDFYKGTANLICLDLGKTQDLEVNSYLKKNLKKIFMTDFLKCIFPSIRNSPFNQRIFGYASAIQHTLN